MREGRCSRLGLVLESWSGADQFSESEEESPGKGIFLRSVSELRQDSEQQEDPKQSFREEESSFLRQSEGVPDFHVRIAMEKNRKKPRLIHHWFGRDLTVYHKPAQRQSASKRDSPAAHRSRRLPRDLLVGWG